MDFSRNVFINCPFDAAYKRLLRPLIFTIRISGFIPRIASERFDSGEVRILKINELITASKFSIHDLSRIRSTTAKEYSRLNMPLELGLDLGCKLYHRDEKYRSKKFLILEDEQFSVQKALSDFSFADCKHHQNKPEEMVTLVRNWFVETGSKGIMPASEIWYQYNLFISKLHLRKKPQGYTKKDIQLLPMREFLLFVDEAIQTIRNNKR